MVNSPLPHPYFERDGGTWIFRERAGGRITTDKIIDATGRILEDLIVSDGPRDVHGDVAPRLFWVRLQHGSVIVQALVPARRFLGVAWLRRLTSRIVPSPSDLRLRQFRGAIQHFSIPIKTRSLTLDDAFALQRSLYEAVS